MNSDDPLNDPVYGIDAKSTINRDYALGLIGFLRVLANEVKGSDNLSDEVARRLAAAWSVSTLPVHRYGPTEDPLDPATQRAKLHEMLHDAVAHLRSTIPDVDN